MARKRDPNRDKAFEIFIERNGEVMNREIASLLNVPEKTISAWKSRDKWNEVLRKNECSTAKEKCSTTNKGGAPPGNQNAKGNKGNSRASPPEGNKNAVATGQYETIFAEYLSDEEKELFETETEPFLVMQEEVALLRIRQRRMMKRIQDAEKGLNQKEQQILYELRGRKKVIERKGKPIELSFPELQMTEMKEKTFRKITDILVIEEALTKISNQLARAIKQLNDLEMNKKRKELISAQIEFTKSQSFKLKLENNEKLPDEEMEDDGFLDALGNMASDKEVWPDEEVTDGDADVQET